MANIEVDVDKFLLLMKAALEGAAVPKDEPKPKKTRTTKEVEEKPKRQPRKKRYKHCDISPAVEVIETAPDGGETVDQIVNYPTPQRPDNWTDNTIFAIKRVGGGAGERIATTGPVSILDSKRQIQFVDDRAVGGDGIKYKEPIPTMRAPAQKVKFKCDVCFRDFEGYYSEFPQALETYRDSSVGVNTSERVTLKCNDCAGGPAR